MKLLLRSSAALLGALLSAQGPAPFRFVPADATFVMRIAAPAKWQDQFATTHVATLLGTEGTAPLVAQAKEGLQTALERLRSEGKVDVDVLERMLADYRGELVVALRVDFKQLMTAQESGEPPPMWGSLTLVPDASFDLAALATALGKAIEDNAEVPITDLTIGEHRLRAATAPEDVAMTLPAIVDDQLVMLFGKNLEETGAHWLGTEDRMAAAGDGQSLWLQGDLKSLMAFAIEQAGENLQHTPLPMDGEQIARDLGFGALEGVTLSLGTAGKNIVGELALALAANDRGLFDLVPADTNVAKMLRLVPPGMEGFSAIPFRLATIYDVVAKIWGGMGEAAPMPWEEAMAGFAESMKVRLKEDVLDHLGNGLLMVQDVPSAGDLEAFEKAAEDNPVGAALNGCYALQLRDGKAFSESLEKMLRARGLHAARKTSEYQGANIHLLRLAGFIELEYAVTEDLLLLATGANEAPRQHLRAILDGRKEAGEGQVPAAATAHIDALPPGWVGLSVTPLGRSLSMVGDMMKTAMASGEPVPGPVAPVLHLLSSLGAEMVRLQIGSVAAAVYVDAQRMAVRYHW